MNLLKPRDSFRRRIDVKDCLCTAQTSMFEFLMGAFKGAADVPGVDTAVGVSLDCPNSSASGRTGDGDESTGGSEDSEDSAGEGDVRELKAGEGVSVLFAMSRDEACLRPGSAIALST